MPLETSVISPHLLKKQALKDMGVCLRKTWFYAPPDYLPALQAFQERPELFQDDETVIWRVKDRVVRKITLPEEYGGATIAFKSYDGNKPLRYAVHPSKTAIEALNFTIFAKLGIPMAPLVFVGDERYCFYLKRSYIATLFAQDCQDGRAFSPTCPMDGTPEQFDFIHEVLSYLAQLHSLHCFHRGAHVYNFLWKKSESGQLSTTWIDVASCRFLSCSEKVFTQYIVKDLADFFRDLEISDQAFREAMSCYGSHNPKCLLATDLLMEQVRLKTLEVRSKVSS